MLVIIQTVFMIFSDFKERINKPLSFQIMQTIEYYVVRIFDIFFFLEVFLKVVAMGLLLGQGTYLKSITNIYELIVALSGIFDFVDLNLGKTNALDVISIFRFHFFT